MRGKSAFVFPQTEMVCGKNRKFIELNVYLITKHKFSSLHFHPKIKQQRNPEQFSPIKAFAFSPFNCKLHPPTKRPNNLGADHSHW